MNKTFYINNSIIMNNKEYEFLEIVLLLFVV